MKLFLSAACLGLGLCAAVGIGERAGAEERTPGAKAGVQVSEAEAAVPGAGVVPSPVSVIDGKGNTVTLRRPARRIVPLYAGISEQLCALGLQDRIAARTAADDILPESLPVIGTHMRPNAELVIALQPDLAVQFECRGEAVASADRIEASGIAVARFCPTDFESLFASFSALGALAGKDSEAAALERSLQARLDAARRKTAGITRPPRIFFEVRRGNLLGAGRETMAAAVIRAAGGANALDGYSQKLVRLNEEALIMLNPDIYLVQEGAMNKKPLPLAEEPRLGGLAAVKNGMVRTVSEDMFSRPGPRSVQAVEELAEIILEWDSRQAACP